jgi:hypothetical protein
MQFIPSRWWIWVSINLVGIGVFISLAMPTWIEPELANVPGASAGDPIIWGLTALPILVIFFLLHLIFGFALLSKRLQLARPQGLLLGALTFLCWVAAFTFDNVHHGV